MPDSTEGLFENVSPCPLSLKVYEGHVELNFDALPIYRYMLFRTDVFGKALIYSAKGVDGEVSLSDVPIGFGDAVNYELVCALGENADISATTSKLAAPRLIEKAEQLPRLILSFQDSRALRIPPFCTLDMRRHWIVQAPI